MNRLKTAKYKNKAYGKWIHENVACCVTGNTSTVDPHHIIGHGYSATGTKAPDCLQMALCHDLHLEIHQHGWKAFEDKYAVSQKQMVAQTILVSHAKEFLDIQKLDEDGHIPQWLWDEIGEFSP
ncbi:HNH endonuclease [Vibrio phage D273]|nr:hypothetical protein PODOV060v1_p0087 [Vibrio phage 234P8]QZI91528.1 hypothetical protein PODOV087v1_p0023 [Vibrio phage 431E45.1]QZI91610.1 hypothetical protein PODOV086v1_p0026 [Vibrio phage 431E46.1]QZI91720.1 hypothetical protein PODOV088v1_p0059 [Vibrio phage 431E48.2]